MNRRDEQEPGIVRVVPALDGVRSNVTACSNVFPRSDEFPQPERDVAFRCRVRGAVAIRNIVPPGIIDTVSGRHEIRTLAEADRAAAFDGTLADTSFALLPEQVAELSPFRCILCRRSTVSVWFEGGCVRRKFVRCMCERHNGREESR